MSLVKYKINLILIVSTFFMALFSLIFDDNSLYNYVNNFENETIVKEVDTSIKEEIVLDKSDLILVSNRKWIFPVEGNYVITTNYGYGHQAIDIYGYNGYGSNILAANSGSVIGVYGGCIAGNLRCNGGGGNYIIIKHDNNFYSVYMHLSSIKVKVGDNVTFGQYIGTMGNTGNVIPVPNSTNPYLGTHLHFAIYVGEPYKGGYAINPLTKY